MAIRASLAAGFLCALPAVRGSAQTAPLPAEQRYEWNAEVGYGLPAHLHSPGTRDREIFVEPGVGIRLTSRLQYLFNAHYERFFSPDGYVIGVLPLGGRFYAGGGPVFPYVGIQMGLSWTNLHILELSRTFNFLVEGSLGVRRRFGEGPAWLIEARFAHISNAGSVEPNIGHNTVGLMVGAGFR